VLLGASNIMTLWQILNDLLARPTARKQPSLRLRETPLDVGNEAIVGGRGTKLIWILQIDGLVRSTYSKALDEYEVENSGSNG
jgi:hypothetical protein